MSIISVSSGQGILSSLGGVDEGKKNEVNLLTRTHGELLGGVHGGPNSPVILSYGRQNSFLCVIW